MATKSKSLPKVDLAALGQAVQSQFRGLNPNEPATWPIIPRAALYLGLMIAIVVVLWQGGRLVLDGALTPGTRSGGSRSVAARADDAGSAARSGTSGGSAPEPRFHREHAPAAGRCRAPGGGGDDEAGPAQSRPDARLPPRPSQISPLTFPSAC